MAPVNPKYPFESHNTLLTLITLQYTIIQYNLPKYTSPLNVTEGCIITRHEVSKPQQHSVAHGSAWAHLEEMAFLQLSSHLVMEPVTNADSI